MICLSDLVVSLLERRMNDIFEDSYLNDMNVSMDFQEQQELDHRASCHR